MPRQPQCRFTWFSHGRMRRVRCLLAPGHHTNHENGLSWVAAGALSETNPWIRGQWLTPEEDHAD